MEAKITIEQFDNGISLKWSSPSGQHDEQNILAVDGNEEAAIGKMIWDDIKMMMDSKLRNVVTMEIKYTAEE